ncbi:hypothetical protein H4R24_002298 [Coemansia sp. RSA 988]|nr:hypothetical protein H4R24_002298 [Coemansia sp. RSA 988]
MFGRLNAKLKHLKESSHSAQITEHSAGPSSVTSENPASPSAFGSYVSNSPTAISRAASPSATLSGGFQAARVAAAAKGLALNTHVRQQQHQQQQPAPVPSNSDSPALRSYHLYVGTPLENAFSPLTSPTTASTSVGTSPPAKRRLSSPHIGQTRSVVARDTSAHPAKHTRTEGHEGAGESLAHYHQPLSVPLPAADGSAYAAHLQQQQLQSQLLNPGQPHLYQQPVALPTDPLHAQAAMLSQSNQPPQQHVYGQQQQQQQQQQPPIPNGPMAAFHGAVQLASSTITQSVCNTNNEQPIAEGRALNDFQLLHTLGKRASQCRRS